MLTFDKQDNLVILDSPVNFSGGITRKIRNAGARGDLGALAAIAGRDDIKNRNKSGDLDYFKADIPGWMMKEFLKGSERYEPSTIDPSYVDKKDRYKFIPGLDIDPDDIPDRYVLEEESPRAFISRYVATHGAQKGIPAHLIPHDPYAKAYRRALNDEFDNKFLPKEESLKERLMAKKLANHKWEIS